jgi:kinesin family member 2/24
LAPQRRSQRLAGGGAGSAAQPPGASGASQAAMGDSDDAVMARWLQSAGLQHLAASSGAAPTGAYRGGMAGLGGAGGGGMLPSMLVQVRFFIPG